MKQAQVLQVKMAKKVLPERLAIYAKKYHLFDLAMFGQTSHGSTGQSIASYIIILLS